MSNLRFERRMLQINMCAVNDGIDLPFNELIEVTSSPFHGGVVIRGCSEKLLKQVSKIVTVNSYTVNLLTNDLWITSLVLEKHANLFDGMEISSTGRMTAMVSLKHAMSQGRYWGQSILRVYYKDRQIRWRNEVLARDNLTCRICGRGPVSADELHVHHLDSSTLFPNKEFDLDNGVTLCGKGKGNDCHFKFHKWMGGYRNLCKREDFDRFVASRRKTNIVLKSRLINHKH